ncbi:hypothetical protein GCM10009839_30380 [Catenulispora yoronensis]|uniref:DUF2321 domain-containing protein n=1 Tax=Catenulispora yoronensis TaxID=450799 RepID=A0ABP5FM00_9ACTN
MKFDPYPTSPAPDPTFWRPGEPGDGAAHGYQAAIVCHRGHVALATLTRVPGEDLGFCNECGSKLIARCRNCRIRIRGREHAPGYADWTEFVPPKFCDGCGEPHPWVDRAGRINQLENLLDEEEIDEATRLLVMEDLDRLRQVEDVPEERQLVYWKRIKTAAPHFLTETALKIAVTLMTEKIKKETGLG